MRRLLVVSALLLFAISCQAQVAEECRTLSETALCAEIVVATCERATMCVDNTPEFEVACQEAGLKTCAHYKTNPAHADLVYDSCLPALLATSCDDLMRGIFPDECTALYVLADAPDAGV